MAADYSEEVTLNGIPCRMDIYGAQSKKYQIDFSVLNTDDLDVDTEEGADKLDYMYETSGLRTQVAWDAPGSYDPAIRKELIGYVTSCYLAGTLPTVSDPAALAKAVTKVVKLLRKPIVKKLEDEDFPVEAMPFFQQFAEEDLACAIGRTINGFWNWVNQQY